MKGVGARTVREELNREEDTNVTVKRHVCTRDVRPREKTEGRVKRDRESTWTCTRIGWERAKGIEKREVGWDGQRFMARSRWSGTWGEK